MPTAASHPWRWELSRSKSRGKAIVSLKSFLAPAKLPCSSPRCSRCCVQVQRVRAAALRQDGQQAGGSGAGLQVECGGHVEMEPWANQHPGLALRSFPGCQSCEERLAVPAPRTAASRDCFLSGKAEFGGSCQKRIFCRPERTNSALLGAVWRRLGAAACSAASLCRSPTVAPSLLTCLLTNRSNYVLHRFMPNALSSEGGSQVLRCHESQVFPAGEGARSALSLQS